MPRRRAPAVLIIALVSLALLPAVAGAATSAVKNASGAKVGSVTASGTGFVYRNGGGTAGHYTLSDGAHFVLRESDYSVYGELKRVAADLYKVRTRGAPAFNGRARRAGGRWQLEKNVSGAWRVRGSVSGSVSGWSGVAALWVLIWK